MTEDFYVSVLLSVVRAPHKWFGQETICGYGARVSLTARSLSGLTNYKSGRLSIIVTYTQNF